MSDLLPSYFLPGLSEHCWAGSLKMCGKILEIENAMEPDLSDTPRQIEEMLLHLYGSMSPREKLHRVFDLNQAIEELVSARLRAQYGSCISDRELRLRLAALSIDRATMVNAFGWDPETEGY